MVNFEVLIIIIIIILHVVTFYTANVYCSKRKLTVLGTVHFLRGRGGEGGGLVGFGGGEHTKKWLSREAISKNKGERGGSVKYFRRTLKWHNE